MPASTLSRDELASRYLESLPFEPYPLQEEALLAWFTSNQGVLVCTPTGTGKTLIAEAALFEALHTGRRAYYTTPLIALTEQKLREMQEAAQRWGFSADSVGLVTGNRRVNADAPVLVVVAEILFNRLLHREAFQFDDVAAVVMDEFHSFNDPERGIVWEFTLGLLPPHVRLLLLSATVGNAVEFCGWLRRAHQRDLELVQGTERKIPLVFQWVGDQLLTEQIERMAQGDEAHRLRMAQGDEAHRLTPALVFCFNREECWTVAEQLKGKSLIDQRQKEELARQLDTYDWSRGAGPKLRQLLQRGVGVHHAGVLPSYRRQIEALFQRKLLSVCVCTETLAAGINLPARSVVLPQLVKGPPDRKKLIDASAAHQMFGRAGRPQFDTQGYVFALAHEDDVKILRWREKYDQIPEDTKDPGLRKAKKALKKKMPTRRANQQYWSEADFERLRNAPPGRLASRGPLPWRLLAHMLDATPDVDLIRQLVGRRLMPPKQLDVNQKMLERMLLILWRAGYVTLEPHPPRHAMSAEDEAMGPSPHAAGQATASDSAGKEAETETRASPIGETLRQTSTRVGDGAGGSSEPAEAHAYRPERAHPTERLAYLLRFRGVNPLYGVFLINHLGVANEAERLQAMESVLQMPGSVARHLRVPPPDQLPPGPLAVSRLDPHLLQLGLATPAELGGEQDEEDESRGMFAEERPRVLTLADKLRLLFDYDFPGVHDVDVQPVWAAGEVLEYGGDFNKFVTSKGLQKQEGILLRHLLRLILLLAEFQQLCPPDTTPEQWRGDLQALTARLADCCRQVDPTSTDKALEEIESLAEGDD